MCSIWNLKPTKEQKVGKKFIENFFSSRDGSEKSVAEIRERKKTTLHLLFILYRCKAVFGMFSSLPYFCTFFRSIPTGNKILLKASYSLLEELGVTVKINL